MIWSFTYFHLISVNYETSPFSMNCLVARPNVHPISWLLLVFYLECGHMTNGFFMDLIACKVQTVKGMTINDLGGQRKSRKKNFEGLSPGKKN